MHRRELSAMSIYPLNLEKCAYKKYVRSQTMVEGVDYRELSQMDSRGHKYETLRPYKFYWLNRKTISIPKYFRTDGATCAKDLVGLAWHIHDHICVYPYWDDGTPISNLQASWIYRSILIWHGKPVRSRLRFLATFLFGGSKVKRDVGWV